MTAKQVLDLVEAVLESVEKNLVDPATGEFYPSDIQKDIQVAEEVKKAFEANGFDVPDNVDKAFAVAKAIVVAFGIK